MSTWTRARSYLRSAFGLSLAESAAPETAERGDTGYGYGIGARAANGALAKRLRNLEQNWELYERRGYVVYDRMRFSDPKVAGLLRAMRLPILGAQVRIEPSDPEDGRAKEIADFISANLLHGLADSWRATLSQFLLYLCHGHAPFEIIWKVEDGKALIERFAYRPPASIPTNEIYIARGRIDHIQQVLDTGEAVEPIPGEKLLWFCHEREGDNWRGTPLLRPMFKPWFAKERLEIMTLIAADHGNGTPVVIAPEGGWGRDENGNDLGQAVDAALEAFGLSENGYFDFPYGTEFSLVAANASIDELTKLKQSFEQEMSNVAIAQVLDLGKTETGSRALGNTMSDMFADSLGAIATDIEDTINAAGGPIEQLVAYNFSGADDLIPKLRFGSISKLDLRTLAAGLYQLYQMQMPFGEETWEWIRSELDLPALKAEDATATNPNPKQGAAPAGTADPSQPAAEAAPTKTSEFSLAGNQAFWRAPTALESYVDLTDLSARMDAAPAVLRAVTQAVRDAMIAELVYQVRPAIESGHASLVAALAAEEPPLIDELTAAISAVYRRAADAGRAQVRDELLRQRAGAPVAARIVSQRRGEAIQTAEPSGRGKADKPWPGGIPALPPALRNPAAYLAQAATASAHQLAGATQSALIAQAMRALSSPADDEAVAEMTRRASDEAALRLGATVTQMMVDGRSSEALDHASEIADAVYSAILDGNTCVACEPMDGEITTDLAEAASWVPNPDCEGGDRCRCICVYELATEAA
jgi:phage gp29-like protein